MLILKCALLVVCVALCTSAQDIFGCGGFVQSSVNINFEKVEILLYTKQGAFKSKTECAPNNGYFLVAVYDKGDYILKINPPTGWGFAPTEIELAIDGKTDACSKGEDINFKFTGFSLIGTVGSLGRDQGPVGVTLSLKGSDGVEIGKSTTEEGGSYAFNNILPGEYEIVASHANWAFKQDKVAVKVVNDNVADVKDIVVSGYDVRGRVLSGGEPIQGVSFMLFSSTVQKEDVKSCSEIAKEALDKVAVEIEEKPLCHVISSSQGEFVFPIVPSGDYVLVPFYVAQNIVFDVVPSKISFSVNYRSVVLKTPFQVYGFSVSGRIVDTSGLGVGDVLITATNEKGEKRLASSRADGKFLMENVTTGNYVFQMEKEHMTFQEEKVFITPNTPTVPDLKAKSYSVCGRIDIAHLPQGVFPLNQRKVLLQPENAQNTEMKSITADASGKFCFDAIPGKYKMEALVAPSEIKSGFLLVPRSMDVTVENKPILDVVFTQFRANVGGKVKCIGSCQDVTVHMTSLEKSGQEKVFATLKGEGDEIEFVFEKVLPGKYKIVPSKKKWCWNPSHLEIEVVDADITDLALAHDGFYLKCTISHNITLNFALDKKEKEVGSFDLKKGTNKFCLKEAGIYELTPKSCYKFEKETYLYDTKDPQSLTLSVVGYKVEMKVNSEKAVSDLTLAIKSSFTRSEVMLTPTEVEVAPQEKVEGESSGEAAVPTLKQYELVHWGRLGEVLTISAESKEILFYPKTTSVTVQESCPGGSVSFEGKEGMFIEGKVTPPISNVVVVINTKESNLGETTTITVRTDADGKYRVGPMHSDIKYDVSASRPGYHITPKEEQGNDFIAQKLSQITVKVEDENEKPMASVLLSLSGGQYRKNNLTENDGSLVFTNLSPGQYFLRPMQKEYSFEPNSKIIDVSEGEDIVVIAKGKRVAFSCHGSTLSLAGVPEENVAVEAVGLDGCSQYHEESVSDSSGFYRLRGLQPGCSYSIQMSSSESNSHVERITPSKQVIKVDKDDISDVNFIVFLKATTFQITAYVDTAVELLPNIKIQVFSEDDLDSPVHSLSPGMVKFLQFPHLQIKTYVVKIESSLSSKTHDIKTTSVTVTPDANTLKKHIRLKFDAQKKRIDMEPTQSVIALPLAVALVFICYNYDTALALLMKINSFIQNINKKEDSDASSDDDEDSSKSSKRKKR